jgi:hypothetical protein
MCLLSPPIHRVVYVVWTTRDGQYSAVRRQAYDPKCLAQIAMCVSGYVAVRVAGRGGWYYRLVLSVGVGGWHVSSIKAATGDDRSATDRLR